MKLRRSKALHETVEINITAFLNLMVILVPFLLITAVFSRMTVLELSLPALQGAEQEPAQKDIDLELQLAVYEDALEIRDANLGRIKGFDTPADSIDWTSIREVLVEIKRRYPQETSISLLLDEKVPYKTLINIMDHVRSAEIVNVGTLETVELFPDIAIGDAPDRAEAEQTDVALDSLPVGEGAEQKTSGGGE